MLFDSHCHLDEQAYGSVEEVDSVIERALAAGVGRMLSVGSGYGVGAAERAVKTAQRHEVVYASVGVHPHDAKDYSADVEAHLRNLAANPKVLAIGEMGLDFHYNLSPKQKQREAFISQIRLAADLNLPIIIHDRDTDGETLDVLIDESAFDGPGVLFHCFCGDVDEMKKIVHHGGYISIPGIVTFKKSAQMKEVASVVPLDRLLIETDSPFLTPRPYRGTKNEPGLVRFVAKEIAKLKNIDEVLLANATFINACKFFQMDLKDFRSSDPIR